MIKHLKEKRQTIRLGCLILCLFALSLVSEFFHHLVISHPEHICGCDSHVLFEMFCCDTYDCHESCQICKVAETLFKVGSDRPVITTSIPLLGLTEPNWQQFAFITSEYFFPFPVGPPFVS